MFQGFLKALCGFFGSLKRSFLRFLAECAEAVRAAKAQAADYGSTGKNVGASVGEHACCAVCELARDLFKSMVKIFVSSLLASFFGGRVIGRFLPVHSGWAHGANA